MTVTKTRYPDVYKDEKGKYFYQVFLGRDVKGKKHFKKSRKDSLKRPFTSARAAHIEAQKVKQIYLNVNLGDMTYASFIKEKFLPKYKADVENIRQMLKVVPMKHIQRCFYMLLTF